MASLESSVDPFSKSPRVKRKQLMQEEEMDNLSRLERKSQKSFLASKPFISTKIMNLFS